MWGHILYYNWPFYILWTRTHFRSPRPFGRLHTNWNAKMTTKKRLNTAGAGFSFCWRPAVAYWHNQTGPKHRFDMEVRGIISVWKLRVECSAYLDAGGGVQHVLQAEVAAAAQVVFAEVLDELQVVQPIGQRHVLLQADVWEDEGKGSHRVSVWRQYDFRGDVRGVLFRKHRCPLGSEAGAALLSSMLKEL